MSDLFLPTLEMMGLTFAIGFFVAFIIKLIASAADSLDFYSSHQQELLRLRRIKKFRKKMELMLHTPSMHGNIFGNDTNTTPNTNSTGLQIMANITRQIFKNQPTIITNASPNFCKKVRGLSDLI